MRTFLAIISSLSIGVVGLAALFVLGSLLPVAGNYSFRIVESGSMEPAIQTGSVIAVMPRNEYRVGDIVLFVGTDINPQPTTHRIIQVDEAFRFVTKGDANEDPDYRHITEEEILGKVFLDIPYAGYAAQFFATPTGKATLVVLILLVVAGTCVPWKRLLVRRDKEEISL